MYVKEPIENTVIPEETKSTKYWRLISIWVTTTPLDLYNWGRQQDQIKVWLLFWWWNGSTGTI